MRLLRCLNQSQLLSSLGNPILIILALNQLVAIQPLMALSLLPSSSQFIRVHSQRRFGSIVSMNSMTITSKPAETYENDNSNSAMTSLTLHWFRPTNLRLHDNPSLCRSVQLAHQSNQRHHGQASSYSLLPVFVFDPRLYGSHASVGSSLKCGVRRAQFLLEAVADLRHNLQQRGSGLLVALGNPEQVLADIVRRASAISNDHTNTNSNELLVNLVCQEEVCSEELAVDKAVRSSIAKTIKHVSPGSKFSFEAVWGSTLYDPESLPFDNGVSGIPDTFTPFRNQVEKNCHIGLPLNVPSPPDLALPSTLILQRLESNSTTSPCSLSYLPTLTELGYVAHDSLSVDSRSALPENYRGGETYALQRVHDYLWTKDLLKVYFDTRNGMIGPDYSTKFAPWLALGNLSPRYVAKECARYEEERVKNKSTYWVVFELLWRDYFKFFAKKHGDRIFYLNGTTGGDKRWGMNPKMIQAWKEGRTGYPLVDANMRELAATGFMSNRGRQNVCSFLAIDMNMDWRHGARHFEETLLDYDVHSNWGNWCSGAGMTGGRLNRFNIVKQSKDYDFGGDYVRLWCPELTNVPDKYVHSPWEMSEEEMNKCGVKIGHGRDYPSPIVDPHATPRVLMNGEGNGGHGRGKSGGRGHNGQRSGYRGESNGNRNNSDRGRGQRQGMKSLKEGSYRFDSKFV